MLDIKNVKEGDIVILDNHFDCINAGPVTITNIEREGLGFKCPLGFHFLEDHVDDEGNLIGMTAPSK